MVKQRNNDTAIVPDLHGHAAMLLVESLIHGLIARSVISVADAMEIVATATEVQAEFCVEKGVTPAEFEQSLAMLTAMRRSLAIDLGEG